MPKFWGVVEFHAQVVALAKQGPTVVALFVVAEPWANS